MSATPIRAMLMATAVMALTVAFTTHPTARGADRTAAPAPVLLSNADALKREQEILKISGVPPVAVNNSPSTYPMDDQNATPYPNLPDPLTFKNGTKVRTAAQWKLRRVEVQD